MLEERQCCTISEMDHVPLLVNDHMPKEMPMALTIVGKMSTKLPFSFAIV